MPHRSNSTYVSNADAHAAWTPFAHDALIETARTYGAVIHYQDLAALVQDRSGITTDQVPAHWVGKVLDRVAAEAVRRDEPPLAALCVRQDGSIGQGYGGTPRSPTETEVLAAEHRLLCYRQYADDLPADGGEISVHRPAPRVVSRTRATPATRPHAAATPTRREVTCHECFLIVAAGPTCSSCGAPLPAFVG